MNTDVIKGKWQQIKGDLQKTWGKITNAAIAKMAMMPMTSSISISVKPD